MTLEFVGTLNSGNVPYFRNGHLLVTIDSPEINYKFKKILENNPDINGAIVLFSTPSLKKVANLKTYVEFSNNIELPVTIVVGNKNIEDSLSKLLENLKFSIILESEFKKKECWLKTSILTDDETSAGVSISLNNKNILFIGNTNKMYMFDAFVEKHTDVYISTSENYWSTLNFFNIVPILCNYFIKGATINVVTSSKKEKNFIANYITSTGLPFKVI